MKRTPLMLLILLAATPVAAKSKAGPKGLWTQLVQEGASWTLKNSYPDSSDAKSLVIKVEGVHKVGKANVAHLRFFAVDASGAQTDFTPNPPESWQPPLQVAVTAKGIYFLADELDDAAIAKAIKKAPAFSEPPKTGYSKKTQRKTEVYPDGSKVCVGYEDRNDCGDESCLAQICLAPGKGIVNLQGPWAPDNTSFEE